MFRKVSLLLILSVLLVCMAGCLTAVTPSMTTNKTSAPMGSTTSKTTTAALAWLNKAGLPIVNETITYDLLAPRTSAQGEWNTLWVFREITKRTGIKINPETIDASGWEEKKNLRFATNDLPDFFSEGLSQFDVINYGSQGTIIPLNDLLSQYATNILQVMSLNKTIEKSIKATDGKIYMLPAIDTTPRERSLRRYYLNTAWLKKLNLAVPKTLDDFNAVLKAFKTSDPNASGSPDEIPAGGIFNTSTAIDIPILAAFGFVDTRIDVLSNKVIFVPTQDNYKAYLQYMNKLYIEKLIDQEYFSQTEDQFKAKGSKALYGAFCYAADWILMSDANLYGQYSMVPPMTSAVNSTPMWPARDVSLWGGYAITKNCTKPEGLIRLIDYFFTLEGRIMVRAGVESGTWEGKGGWKWATNSAGQKCFDFDVPEGYTNFNDFRAKLIQVPLPYGDDGTLAGYLTGKDERQVKLTTGILQNHSPYYRTGFPYTYFTKEENEQVNLLKNDIYSYVQQMEAKFIIGDESFDKWSAFIQNVNNMQVVKLVSIYQQAYDRWNK